MNENIREYEIIEQVGKPGGMGTVYKAKHKNLDVIRAIKKLHYHLTQNETIIKRFENEAKSLTILEHSNIVKVYDFFLENEEYYLVMEYIKSSSLASIVVDSPLNEQTAIKYFMQILSTIEFAHDKKILHRDIKPSNILIDNNDMIKVVDFGIAKILDKKGPTFTGVTIGSPKYMAPEQIVGGDVDERSDIYSLGITLFEMLTGQVPFDETSEYKIYEKHKKEKIPSLKEFKTNFSSKLDAIIRKATDKKPYKRYQNVQEFAQAVNKYFTSCLLEEKKSQNEVPHLTAFESIKLFFLKYKMSIVYFLLSIFLLATITYVGWNWKTKNAMHANLKLSTEEVIFNSAIIKWNKMPGISSYSINRKNPESTEFANLAIITTTAYKDTGLIPNSNYTYRIAAIDEDKNPVSQNEINILTSPINIFLKTEKVTKSTINLSWQSINGITEQILYREQIGSRNDDVIEQAYTGMDNNFTDTELSSDQKYSYKLYLKFNNNYEYESDTVVVETKKQLGTGSLISGEKASTKSVGKGMKHYGGIIIRSEPEPADVYFNNKLSGTTPIRKEKILVGTYQVTVTKEGYKADTIDAIIKKGKITEKTFILDEAKGELNIIVKPYGAIYIDGILHNEETDFLYSTKLQTGHHTLTLEHSGLGAKWEKQFSLKESEVKKFDVDFNKYVNVTVVSTPTGEIYLDGKPTGKTTPKIINIRVGLHTISVRKDGFILEGGEKEINLENDLAEPLKFKLRKSE